jgi:hypothetical protein
MQLFDLAMIILDLRSTKKVWFFLEIPECTELRKLDAVAGLGARKKIGVFHAISSIFDVVLTPTGGLAAAVSTEK